MKSVASSRTAEPQSYDALDLIGSCGVIIPAYNEEATLAAVVRTALAAELGPVLVVDDGSRDHTAQVAREAGGQVLSLEKNRGKGDAVLCGARHLQSEVVLLLDADLTGLTPQHLRQLALPVLRDEADMTRGVFTGGRWRTSAAQQLTPQLNGQRALKRQLLMGLPELAGSRYGVEIIISEAAKRQRWRVRDIALPGVSQVMKEEKRGLLKGLFTRLGMYRDILRTYLRQRRHS